MWFVAEYFGRIEWYDLEDGSLHYGEHHNCYDSRGKYYYEPASCGYDGYHEYDTFENDNKAIRYIEANFDLKGWICDGILEDLIRSTCVKQIEEINKIPDIEYFVGIYRVHPHEFKKIGEVLKIRVRDLITSESIRRRIYNQIINEHADKPDYCGISGIKFIRINDWANPQLYYKGHYYNTDLIDYYLYPDYYRDIEDNCFDGSFEEYLAEHTDSVLYCLEESEPIR